MIHKSGYSSLTKYKKSGMQYCHDKRFVSDLNYIIFSRNHSNLHINVVDRLGLPHKNSLIPNPIKTQKY